MRRRHETVLGLVAILIWSAAASAGDPVPCGIPAAVDEIESVVPFNVAKPYRNPAMRSSVEISRGLVVVAKVDPSLVAQRAEATPVLYAANGAAEIVCTSASGRLVAIVPGDVDLDRTPVWFGAPAFPDRVDVAAVASALSDARSAGILPLPHDRIEAARRRGGGAIAAADRAALFERLRPLVEEACRP